MSTRLMADRAMAPIVLSGMGLSQESRNIETVLAKFRRESRAPISFSWRESLRNDLASTAQSCASSDWDGYGAEPVSTESASATLQLIDALPEYILPPDVVPEPSGEIALEWRTGDQRHFTVAVSGPIVVYAGIFGGSSKKYGEERFFDGLPSAVLEILANYFSAV
ncbi:MAG: hypothetical protein ACRDF4_00100 [Rhabdochlamydiaceae bacterium]